MREYGGDSGDYTDNFSDSLLRKLLSMNNLLSQKKIILGTAENLFKQSPAISTSFRILRNLKDCKNTCISSEQHSFLMILPQLKKFYYMWSFVLALLMVRFYSKQIKLSFSRRL